MEQQTIAVYVHNISIKENTLSGSVYNLGGNVGSTGYSLTTKFVVFEITRLKARSLTAYSF